MTELQPRTEPGRRLVRMAEEHAPTFRERAPRHDEDASFPSENFDDLKASGAIAAFVPQELGGLGLDSVHDWSATMARLGRADASTAIALNMHLAVTRNLAQGWRGAVASDNAEARERTEGPLRAVVAGQLVICATATEAGTDFLRPMTTATPVDDGWSIEGRKLFVTMSPIAQVMVCNLRVRDPEGDKIGFVFLPMETEGIEPQDDWQALGMRGSGSQSVVFKDCRVPVEVIQIAGEWGRWNPQILMGRTLGNLTLVAVFLGIAERARELAVRGALKQSKPKYGGALANSPGVQHLVGEIDIDLATASAILGSTATSVDDLLATTGGRPPSLEEAHGCMRDYQCAKWTVNQNAIRIVERAMDVCGGGSYMSSHELSRLHRDVRAGPFMQPFSPIEAREYVGQVALGLLPQG